jgi:hypothetical protein
MACCGDRRRTLIQTPQRPAPQMPPPAVKAASAANLQPRAPTSASAGAAATIPVRYVGGARTVVQGSATRKHYAFTAGSVQAVDVRDAAALLRGVGFRRA